MRAKFRFLDKNARKWPFLLQKWPFFAQKWPFCAHCANFARHARKISIFWRKMPENGHFCSKRGHFSPKSGNFERIVREDPGERKDPGAPGRSICRSKKSSRRTRSSFSCSKKSPCARRLSLWASQPTTLGTQKRPHGRVHLTKCQTNVCLICLSSL